MLPVLAGTEAKGKHFNKRKERRAALRARKFLIEKVAIPREEKRNQPLFTGKGRVNALGREVTGVERKREKKEERRFPIRWIDS